MNSSAEDSTQLCFPVDEAGVLLRTVIEGDLLKQKIALLEETSAVQKQQIANLEAQLDIQKQLTSVEARRADVERLAYEREKELTDRAIKMAEVSKPSSNWQISGLLAAVGIILGLLAH